MNEDDKSEEINKIEEAAVKYLRNMSPEQFLEWEEEQEQRYEFVDGEIIPIEAASLSHATIAMNISGEIFNFLKDKPCRVVGQNISIAAKSMKSFFHPDVSIFCEEPQHISLSGETYKNPAVIFEVLSPSTENYDLGKKLFFYMQIDSLKEYIIIDSRKIEVRIGRRQSDNSWKFETLNSSSDALFIETIGMSVRLAEIYSGVKFGQSYDN